MILTRRRMADRRSRPNRTLTVTDMITIPREEGMPHEVLARLINGENPVMVIREWRALSVSELARRSNVHRMQIHDIEAGRKTGSVRTLKALATALDVTLDELV